MKKKKRERVGVGRSEMGCRHMGLQGFGRLVVSTPLLGYSDPDACD